MNRGTIKEVCRRIWRGEQKKGKHKEDERVTRRKDEKEEKGKEEIRS